MDKELKDKVIKIAHILSNKNVYIDDAKYIISVIEELEQKREIMKENAYILQERIDKAIEYIEYKKGLFTKDVVQTKVIEELSNILKGVDK